MKTKLSALLLVLAALLVAQPASAADQKPSEFEALKKQVQVHLATFDDLDFNVFSNQRWDELKHSHAKDVKVHWPDGHITVGIERHIADLKYLFTYAPDTRIKEHPIKIGQGEWTAVYGIMEGTFTKPMTTADGKVIPPNGKSFKLPMATISHWNKDGVMDEEFLFWDNATYMAQLGLGK